MYLCFLGIKCRTFHAEQVELLRKEKDVTKVPDHTYEKRERERERGGGGGKEGEREREGGEKRGRERGKQM